MAGVGTIAKYGTILSLFGAAFGISKSEGAQEWTGDKIKNFLTPILGEEFLENIGADRIGEFAAPAATLFSSLILGATGSGTTAIFAAIASIAWTAQKMFFPNLFNSLSGASSAPDQKNTLTLSSQEIADIASNIDPARLVVAEALAAKLNAEDPTTGIATRGKHTMASLTTDAPDSDLDDKPEATHE